MSTPAQTLRKRLTEPGPIIAVGAHSPLSARLAEAAGYDAIWASGFEISAAHALPDANILTMAEQLHEAKLMARRVSIPVIADCDNGFGNAINVIRTVHDYEADGIAGICFEDNIFPKRCSFYAGVERELVSIEEHAGKIRAAVEARRSQDFVIIARTEALIVGFGLDEALRRAEAYAEAGADLVLAHSKSEDFAELRAFAQQWRRPTPLVAVPTIYNHVTAEELVEAGFKLVIFANHGLRASIRAMRDTYGAMLEARRSAAVEDRICTLKDVYEIIGVSEMRENEARYMPAGGEKVTAVILAAGSSDDLGELTADRPKAMLPIRGKPILEHQVDALNACGIRDVAVVRGYRKEKVELPGIRPYDNDEWQNEGELSSLLHARNELQGRVVVLYGDILFAPGILEKLLKSRGDVAIVVDRAWNDRPAGAAPPTPPDLVQTDGDDHDGYRFVPGGDARVLGIGRDLDRANGEFAGMLMLSPAGTQRFLETYNSLVEADRGGPFHEARDLQRAALTDMLQELVARGEAVTAVSIYKGWSEVDTFDDYRQAWGD